MGPSGRFRARYPKIHRMHENSKYIEAECRNIGRSIRLKRSPSPPLGPPTFIEYTRIRMTSKQIVGPPDYNGVHLPPYPTDSESNPRTIESSKHVSLSDWDCNTYRGLVLMGLTGLMRGFACQYSHTLDAQEMSADSTSYTSRSAAAGLCVFVPNELMDFNG